MRCLKTLTVAAIFACALAASPSSATAAIDPSLLTASTYWFNFTRVTSNYADVGNTLFMRVDNVDVGTNPGIKFTFYNTGAADSRILKIWFDDGEFIENPHVYADSGTGVEYDINGPDASTPNGVSPQLAFQNWETSTNFDATKDGGQGVINGSEQGPLTPPDLPTGEWMSVSFTLDPSQTFATTVAALLEGVNEAAPGSHDFRVALHLGGIGPNRSDEESDKYILGGGFDVPGGVPIPNPVPEPASLAVWGLGLIAAGFSARRRRNRS